MRWIRPLSAALAVVIVGGATADGAVGHVRSSAFASGAASLEGIWARDAGEGVPAASLTALRTELAQSPQQGAAWWAPSWFGDDGSQLLAGLNRRTDAAWQAALTVDRRDAGVQIAAAQQLTASDGSQLPAATVSDIATWPRMLAAAPTPAAEVALTAVWHKDLVAAKNVIAQAQLAAAINGAGGAAGLVAASTAATTVAQSDNLDPGNVPELTAAVHQEIAGGTDTTATAPQLVVALKQLRGLIAANGQVTQEIGPLAWSVAQDAAEQNAGSAAALAALAALKSAFHDARSSAQMAAVAAQTTTLQTQTTATLAADVCGHTSVGAGKVITISLTQQEGVFYQDGCVVQATPVTTGRPALPTPPGNDHVFYKTSPFVMVSMWPPSSPFWYPNSPVNWVMEFLADGYFLHDAPWESPSQFGAGSENSGAASHGCIHVPTPVMRWLYGWTPVGTPVIVSA